MEAETEDGDGDDDRDIYKNNKRKITLRYVTLGAATNTVTTTATPRSTSMSIRNTAYFLPRASCS